MKKFWLYLIPQSVVEKDSNFMDIVAGVWCDTKSVVTSPITVDTLLTRLGKKPMLSRLHVASMSGSMEFVIPQANSSALIPISVHFAATETFSDPKAISYMVERVVGTVSFEIVFQEKCLETGDTVSISVIYGHTTVVEEHHSIHQVMATSLEETLTLNLLVQR
ncbi:hypothetical protein KIW84_034463 [Lathyrus oleraceus]|uniref:Uncharacterized protein n=1 Tax=Pisum sativum TaxID=3888 RepID=A0A9D4XZF2_PEA|nr:hypothetical protein KIW84_034463 [Pisum sativum]